MLQARTILSAGSIGYHGFYFIYLEKSILSYSFSGILPTPKKLIFCPGYTEKDNFVPC